MHTYTLDAIALDDPDMRWLLDKETGIRIRGSFRDSGAQLPGRDGDLAGLSPDIEAGTLPITLDILGTSHAQMMRSIAFWQGVFSQRGRLLPLIHELGDGTSIIAMVQAKGSIEPQQITDSECRLPALFTVPGVFWRSLATSDSTANITATQVTTVLVGLAGSSGSINDALIRVKGALSGLVVTDPVSGDSLTVTTALAAGEYLVIDCANWTAKKVTSDTWTGGTDVSQYVVSNRGSGSMFTLNPDFITGVGRIRLTAKGTNPASSPVVTVQAKSSYL